MAYLDINQKVDGKAVTLSLTEKEVETAVGICTDNSVEDLIIMKKHNGGALFFVNPQRAYACQERHKFDYAFTIKAKDLVEARKKNSSKGGNK